jgi:hypothetical protein
MENGVPRREFDDLRGEVREQRLERDGSAASQRLGDRVDDLRDDVADVRDFNKWLVRGLVGAVLIAVVVAFVLQGVGQ